MPNSHANSNAGSNANSTSSKSHGRRHSDKTESTSAEKAKNVSHVPCKFFRQSSCQAGDNCPFSHEVDNVTLSVCKYFQKGNCKFGSKCALAHITPDGRHVNKKSGKESKKKHKEESVNRNRSSNGSTTSQSSDTTLVNQPVTESNSQILSKHSNSSPRVSNSGNSIPLRAFSASSSSLRPTWSGTRTLIEGSAIIDDDDDDTVTEEEGFKEQLIPSALEDLLTPKERERRDSHNSRSEKRPSVPLSGSETILEFSRRRKSAGSFSFNDSQSLLNSPSSSDIWANRHRDVLSPFLRSSQFVGQEVLQNPLTPFGAFHSPDIDNATTFESYATSPIGSPVSESTRLSFAPSRPLTQFHRMVSTEKF